MDQDTFHVPIALWTAAPTHHVAAVSGCCGSLVTGSDTGDLCLWRQDPVTKVLTPRTMVLGRNGRASGVVALTSFHFRGTCVLLAAFRDGLVSAHSMESGDALAAGYCAKNSVVVSFGIPYLRASMDPSALCPVVLSSGFLCVIKIGLVGVERGIVSASETSVPEVRIAPECASLVSFSPNGTCASPHSLLVVSETQDDLDIIGMSLTNAATLPNPEVIGRLDASPESYPMTVAEVPVVMLVQDDCLIVGTLFDISTYRINYSPSHAGEMEFTFISMFDTDTLEIGEEDNLASACFVGEYLAVWSETGFIRVVDKSGTRLASLEKSDILLDIRHVYAYGGSVYQTGSSSGSVVEWKVLQALDNHSGESELLVPSTMSCISDLFQSNVLPGTGVCVCSYLFESFSTGPVFVTGFDNGLLRCTVLGIRHEPADLVHHSEAITVITGLAGREDSILCHPPFMFTASAGGDIAFWRMDTFECIETFSSHLKPITRIQVVPEASGPNDVPETYWIICIGLDNSFSVYSLKFRSGMSISRKFENHLSSTKDISLVSDPDMLISPTDGSESMSKVSEGYVRRVANCCGHDSSIVAVYRNAQCRKFGYFVSVTLSGSVYIWCEMTGHLDRILGMIEGIKFLKSWGLSTPGASIPDGLFLSPTVSNSVFSVVNGIPEELNLQVLAIDIKKLSSGHCRNNLDLTLDGTEDAFNDTDDGFNSGSDFGMVRQFSPDSGLSDLTINDLSPNSSRRSRRLKRPRFHHKRSYSVDSNISHEILNLASELSMKNEIRTALSFLLDWGIADPDFGPASIDSELSERIGVFDRASEFQKSASPEARMTFGIFEAFPSIALQNSSRSSLDKLRQCTVSVLLPRKSRTQVDRLYRWSYCRRFSSVHALAIDTLCMALMTDRAPSAQKALACTLLTRYTHLVPSALPDYVEGSIVALGFYGIHKDEGIHLASRLLLESVVQRIPEEKRPVVFSYWTRFYLAISAEKHALIANLARIQGELRQQGIIAVEDASEREADLSTSPQKVLGFAEFSKLGLLAMTQNDKHVVSGLVLCMFVIRYPNEFDTRLIELLCSDLLRWIVTLLPSEHICISMAADLLARNIDLWRPYISDLSPVLVRLLGSSTANQSAPGATLLAATASRTLLDLARTEPMEFVITMGGESLKGNADALYKIVTVVKKFPTVLLSAMPRVVDIVTRCLDPSDPGLRKDLLRASTSALQVLTRTYPQVSFHQNLQLFAVGTSKTENTGGQVFVYDLRTATRWRVLDGHSGAITAIAFSDEGDLLASYSAEDCSLRVWRLGSGGGVFSGILGSHGKCLKTMGLGAISPAGPVSRIDMLRRVRIEFAGRDGIELTREDSTTCRYGIQVC